MEDYLHLHKQFHLALGELNPELSQKPVELYEPMSYILSLGGKRLRPILALIGCELFNGKIEDAMPAALSVELFHNFSLIHDDIMDCAPLRRGKETVHKKWNENIAILSGDAMLVKAYQVLARSKPNHLPELLRLFNKTAIEVCEGQQLDMNFEKEHQVTIPEYLHMISLKTAVLLGCSLEMGAIAADASFQDRAHLYEFGRLIGVSFQLKDDILDAFGSAEKVGKQTGGDILADKKTYLLLKALEIANEKQREELNSWTGIKEKGKVEAVIKIFEDLNIKLHSEEEASSLYRLALEHLEKLNISESNKEKLKQFSDWIINREH